jgi:hypothetical protein
MGSHARSTCGRSVHRRRRVERLLTLLPSQRLETNTIGSAMQTASIVPDARIREIRTQASDTAKARGSKDCDDVWALLRVHSSPLATMSARGHGNNEPEPSIAQLSAGLAQVHGKITTELIAANRWANRKSKHGHDYDPGDSPRVPANGRSLRAKGWN